MSEIPTNTISNISLIKPRQVKSAIKLLVGITLLSANVSFAEFIFPSNLLNKRGSSTPQPLEVLAVKDQQSSDDNSDSYIEFATDQLGYVGTFRFNLPAKPDKTIQQLIFHANYRGREKSLQKWEFQLLNVKTGKWTHIADNGNVKDGFWSDILTTIIEPSQFINSRNQITLRYVTGSGGNNSQLDFVAFESAVSDSSTDTLESRNLASSQPPTVIKNGSRWQPAPGSKWQIQYTGTINTSLS